MSHAIRAMVALPLAIGGLTLPSALHSQDTLSESIAAQSDQVLKGDQRVDAGTVVEDIVVLDGDLTVAGEVTGDAVVVGGDLILESGGTVRGDATVTGGTIINEGGGVRGEMRTIDGMAAEAIAGAAGAMAAEQLETHAQMEMDFDRSDRSRSWWDPIQEGFAGLISTFAFGLVLAGIGAALVFYGQTNLDTVSDTLRTSTARSAAVGLAAAFLIIPAFVVMVVALAVSIVGIPFLLLAVPLYPLAIIAAQTMGLLAAAHAIGERTADEGRGRMDLRYRNSYAYLFTGVVMLLTPLLVADLLAMTGFLGFIGSLLQFVTWFIIIGATVAGFGAVILSRAGTRRSFVRAGPDALFDDSLFDETNSTEPNV